MAIMRFHRSVCVFWFVFCVAVLSAQDHSRPANSGTGHVTLTGPVSDPLSAGTLTLTPPSAVDEHSRQNVGVYPNPSPEEVWIEPGDDFRPHGLRVYDQAGRLVRDLPVSGSGELKISRESLPAGVYLVILKGSEDSLAWGRIFWQ